MKNVIAIIWDFDKTLINGYMQDPIFRHYGVDASEFWHEVEQMPAKYAKQGVRVNRDTIYLNLFIREARKGGKFEGLNNEILRSFGREQPFFEGIPELFEKTKNMLADDPLAREYNIEVEHYIVSTGFAEVIRGTELMKYVTSIWGCELIEDQDADGKRFISEIGYTIDNTTKTRALFEINKGVNIDPAINVNTRMDDEQRRIDFHNMIYIADGPSDVPAFSLTKEKGGSTFAIYPKGNEQAFVQANQLCKDGRIDMFAEADYREGSTTFMWICRRIKDLAKNIKAIEASKRNFGGTPKHLD